MDRTFIRPLAYALGHNANVRSVGDVRTARRKGPTAERIAAAASSHRLTIWVSVGCVAISISDHMLPASSPVQSFPALPYCDTNCSRLSVLTSTARKRCSPAMGTSERCTMWPPGHAPASSIAPPADAKRGRPESQPFAFAWPGPPQGLVVVQTRSDCLRSGPVCSHSSDRD